MRIDLRVYNCGASYRINGIVSTYIVKPGNMIWKVKTYSVGSSSEVKSTPNKWSISPSSLRRSLNGSRNPVIKGPFLNKCKSLRCYDRINSLLYIRWLNAIDFSGHVALSFLWLEPLRKEENKTNFLMIFSICSISSSGRGASTTASDVDLALAFNFFALNKGEYERGKREQRYLHV